ncbi:hypothetical protein LWI28_020402 [Acer negundo]|uniref:Uncharacterized protein n=1 Tax=Acer negundo TaxID=4023 RepID=A0AAD5NJZ5_ACENE|nr:hypothetical protein LWI28_020402 [Acer negundo]
MRKGDVKEADSGNNSNTKGSIIGAPVQNDKKSASDHNYYDPNLEVTLEIRDDSVAVHSVQPATEGGGGGGEEEEGHEDPEPESKLSWVGSSLLQSASLHIKCMVSFSRRSSDKSTTSSKRYDQMKSAADALKGLKFLTTPKSGEEGNDWNAVEKRFDKLTASTNGLLHSSMFGECIGMKGDSKEFAGELFRAVAQKHKINGESINKTQLEDFWRQISDESFGSRLKTFFDIVDKDADGKITKEEISEVNKLETLLLQSPNKYEKLLRKEHKPTWPKKVKYFLINHWKKVWILMLWLGIVSGLFAYKFVQYRNKAEYDVMGNCVCIAKGAAETLKFNMALILLPVCRKTITWLRNQTKLGGVVPFESNLDFHIVIAAGIAIGVILHGGGHLTCNFPRLIHATKEEYEPMKPYFGAEQQQNYWWFLKGVEGVTGIIMVVLMAIAFTLANPWFRRNKLKNMPEPFKRLTGFNAFWYSHNLFVIVYALLIVHGIYLYLSKKWYEKTTWMYIAVPVLLYTCERLIRAFRSSTETVEVIKASVYPDVLALHMSKPEGFEYKSGQYMFVNCSAVSPFEWHPFSITSAPGDNYLSIHIRALGDWTRQLKTVFSKVPQPPPIRKSETSREEGSNISGFPEIKIDGPYGAPAQDYKTYDVVLLIGLGIGATPMISIVKDIINNIQTIEDNLESALENGNDSSKAATQSTFRTRKAYSYWVTNNQQSFDWFREIMNEVAEADKKGVIELHNYCSSVFKEGDARSAMISMLQSLHHAKNGVDVVSETRVKSHFAKPNWRQVYENIAACHPNSTIGVFYCGTPVAIKQLRDLALEFSDDKTSVFSQRQKEEEEEKEKKKKDMKILSRRANSLGLGPPCFKVPRNSTEILICHMS